MNIKLTSPGTTVLNTEKKYCPENINVSPQLADVEVTGSYEEQTVETPEGNAGIRQVTIAATPIPSYDTVSNVDLSLATDTLDVNYTNGGMIRIPISSDGDVYFGTINNGNNTAGLTLKSSIKNRISTAENDIDNAEKNIASLQTKVSTAESEIDALQTKVSEIDTLQTKVSTAESDIDNAEKNIASLQTKVSTAESEIDTLQSGASTTNSNLSAHTSNKSNPHGVTKAQVGLGNVDNTSDASKPISTAVQAALNNKLDIDMIEEYEETDGKVLRVGIGNSAVTDLYKGKIKVWDVDNNHVVISPNGIMFEGVDPMSITMAGEDDLQINGTFVFHGKDDTNSTTIDGGNITSNGGKIELVGDKSATITPSDISISSVTTSTINGGGANKRLDVSGIMHLSDNPLHAHRGFVSYDKAEVIGNLQVTGSSAPHIEIRNDADEQNPVTIQPTRLDNNGTFSVNSTKFGQDGVVTAKDLSLSGNLTVNGTTTTVNSQNLNVKDKVITVNHGNTTRMTGYAGIAVPKYDGTNDGALVYDSTGTAYVGDAKINADGSISDVDMKPLVTRADTMTNGAYPVWDNATKSVKSGVIKSGSGKNALTFNGDNQAISENTVAFGSSNTAGLKGYKWSTIDFTNRTITLATAHTGGTAVNCEYAVGDVISISNILRHDNCSTITAINGSEITVDALPFTSLKTDAEGWDDYLIYCAEKPLVGILDVGKRAASFGENNNVSNYCSFVAGKSNAGVGMYSAVVGRNNAAAYGGFVAGRENKLYGIYSAGFGNNNTVDGFCISASVFGGSENTIKHSSASAIISGNNKTIENSSFSLATGAKGSIIDSAHSLQLNGYENTIVNGSGNAQISGNNNTIKDSLRSCIIGGIKNSVTSTESSIIVTSDNSEISSTNTTKPRYSAVVGGNDNYIASSNCAVVGGAENRIETSCYAGMIVGSQNSTLKTGAHHSAIVSGLGNEVSHAHTFTHGFCLKTGADFQEVAGRYNDQSTGARVTGGGNADSVRKNIEVLDWNGNLKLAGGLTLGKAPSKDMEAATKKYVDDKLSSTPTFKTMSQAQYDALSVKDANTLYLIVG